MLTDKRVQKAIDQFPATFGLRGRGMPKGSCRINTSSSFVGSDSTVWLVLETYWDEEKCNSTLAQRSPGWLDLCRCTVAELRREIING